MKYDLFPQAHNISVSQFGFSSFKEQSDTKAGIEITIENALGKGVGDSIALVAALTFWIIIALASLTILLLLVGNEKVGFFVKEINYRGTECNVLMSFKKIFNFICM